MSGVSQLEDYLQQLQTEGQLQSRGQFSLDFEKALEKLGGMAVQNPHRWIFFAIQAAVAFQASWVRISASHRSMSLSFGFETPQAAPSLLLDGLAFQNLEDRSGLPGYQEAAENLRQSLLWGRALEPPHFAMLVEGSHPGYMLSTHAAGMELKELPPRPEQPTTCSLLLTPGPRHSALTWNTALQAESVYRLSFCPVPINLDGLDLSLGQSSLLIRNPRRRQGNVKLWERYVLGPPQAVHGLAVLHPRLQPSAGYCLEGRPPVLRDRSWQPASRCYWLDFSAPGLSQIAWSVLRQPRGFCLAEWTQPDGETGALCLETEPWPELALFGGQRVLSQALLTRLRVSGNYLVLSRHGMLLDPMPLDGLPMSAQGWVVVVASNALRTDASGLVPVRDERLERIQQWARAEVYAIHQRMGKSLEGPQA